MGIVQNFSHPQIGGVLLFFCPQKIPFSSPVTHISIFDFEPAMNKFSNPIGKLKIILQGLSVGECLGEVEDFKTR